MAKFRRLRNANRRPTNRAPDTFDYRNVLARTMVVQRRVRGRVAGGRASANRMDYGGGERMTGISGILAFITDMLSFVFLDATPAEGFIIYLTSFLVYRTILQEIKEVFSK
jgi:hypothetical protein